MDNERIERAMAELQAAIVELDSERGLERFVKGHGLQSRYFLFQWNSERLIIDFHLSYARVLTDEAAQAEDNARIALALRMALLLLSADREGQLLEEGEAELAVTAGETGYTYTITGKDGEAMDSGDDWNALIARLSTIYRDEPDDGGVQIIWP